MNSGHPTALGHNSRPAIPHFAKSDKARLPDMIVPNKVRRFIRNIMAQSAVTGYVPDMDGPDLTFCDDIETLPALPGWIASLRGEAHENGLFLSGAALAHLHLVLAHDEVPQRLLRSIAMSMQTETSEIMGSALYGLAYYSAPSGIRSLLLGEQAIGQGV